MTNKQAKHYRRKKIPIECDLWIRWTDDNFRVEPSGHKRMNRQRFALYAHTLAKYECLIDKIHLRFFVFIFFFGFVKCHWLLQSSSTQIDSIVTAFNKPQFVFVCCLPLSHFLPIWRLIRFDLSASPQSRSIWLVYTILHHWWWYLLLDLKPCLFVRASQFSTKHRIIIVFVYDIGDGVVVVAASIYCAFSF